MSGDLPRPRDSLAEATPYRTDTHEAEVRLQSNEWTEPTPLGRYLSPADLESAVINRYPDIAAAELRTLLARRWDVTPEQVILGNGSNEVLLYTFLVFGGSDRALLVFTPTYTMYARVGRLTGMRVHEEGVGVPYSLGADRRIAGIYEAARLPYNVGALTQLVARRIVADETGLGDRVGSVTRERARVARELQRLPELEAFPSAANFVLFRHRTRSASALH